MCKIGRKMSNIRKKISERYIKPLQGQRNSSSCERNESLISGLFSIVVNVCLVWFGHVDNDLHIVRYLIHDTVLHERHSDVPCSHIHLFRCNCKMLCVSIQIHFDVSNDFQFSHLLMTILARFSEPPRMTVLCLPVRPCSFLSSTGIHRISQSCGSHGFPLTLRLAAPCLPVLY